MDTSRVLTAALRGRFFTAPSGPEKHERPQGIHASEISGCQRKLVYTMRGEPKKLVLPDVWYRRFLTGQYLHRMWQAELHAWAKRLSGDHDTVRFEDEVAITPDLGGPAATYGIFSSADGVITLGDHRVIVEIKTKSPDEFARLKAPELAHIEQAHVYMACLGIHETWFLYVNKGNQNWTQPVPPFFIQFNPTIWEGLTTRFNKAWDYVHAGELPDRIEGITCEFCPYGESCLPVYLARK